MSHQGLDRRSVAVRKTAGGSHRSAASVGLAASGRDTQPDHGRLRPIRITFFNRVSARSPAGGSMGLRDLDAKSPRGVCQASVVAVQTLEVLTQAHDGRQVQGVE